MKVVLKIRFDLDAERWGRVTGNDPSRCQRELGSYLSDAIWWLPIMEVDGDCIPHLHNSSPADPPPAAGGTVTVTMAWTIEIPAHGWRTARTAGMTLAAVDTPELARAREDLAANYAAELWSLWPIAESGARMTVLAPFQRIYERAGARPSSSTAQTEPRARGTAAQPWPDYPAQDTAPPAQQRPSRQGG